MLDDYIEVQNIAYKIFKNAVVKNHVMHAYLIESKGYAGQLDLALAFAKYLLCPFGYSNLGKCDNCSQCQRIDDGNFTEITIIEPDGQVIKKEQLDDLQKKFSLKSLESNKKIYIINHAEKMNQSASNSILKFLEEPEDNIIAILIVDNSYQLLNTIVSRCQIVTLNNCEDENKDMLHKLGEFLYDSKEKVDEYCEDENVLEEIKAVVNFVKYYEKNGLDVLLFMRKLWNDIFYDKIKVGIALNIMLLFYRDVVNYKMFKKIDYLLDYEVDIKEVSEFNDITSLVRKVNAVIKARDKIYQNININLLMDKLILDMEEFK